MPRPLFPTGKKAQKLYLLQKQKQLAEEAARPPQTSAIADTQRPAKADERKDG